ncbi:reverse transcriptase domain-containing protein [Tanacetum coccineum]
MPKPTQTVDPSCAQHVKSPRQPIRTPVNSSPIPSNNRQNWNQRMERDLGAGYSFERKPCFVCGSLSHLIKDCDYYEKKMARELLLRAKGSRFNTGKQNINSGSVHVNTARVNRPVSNQTSNNTSPKLSQHTSHNTIAGKGKWTLCYRLSRGPTRQTQPVRPGSIREKLISLFRGAGEIHEEMVIRELEVRMGYTKDNTGGGAMHYTDKWLSVHMSNDKGLSSGDKDSLGDDASVKKQGRIDIGDINTDAEITLIDETQGRINDIIADEDITLIPKLIIKLLKMYAMCVWTYGARLNGDPFLTSRGNKYILVAVDYVSKWVEAQELPTNDARIVIKFLRSLLARFGVPKTLITAAKNRFMELNELMELRDGAYENTRSTKKELRDGTTLGFVGDRTFYVGDKGIAI